MRKNHWFWACALIIILFASPARATILRIAEYNIDCSDQGNNNAVSGSNAGIPAVIQAMGQHHLGTNAQPVDVMTLTELLDTNNNSITSSTLPALVNSLNAVYGAGTYAYDSTPDPTSGGTQYNGPSGIIYNTRTVQVISAQSLAYSGNSSNTNPRAPMRYELCPVGYGSNADFYVYVSHTKSGTGSSDITARSQEAAIIRNDEATLPSTASVIYTGDLNSSPPEAEFTEYQSSGQGQAFDPENFTTSKQYFSDLTDDLEYRDDYELMTSNVLNDIGALGYVSGSLQIFGNNGTTAENGKTNASGNTSLSDLSDASMILNDLMQPYGSDHMPVEADYQVQVSPLPEPSLAVGAILLCGLCLGRRRRATVADSN
jgi:endonuclease/exonuclease/phosphatase family metal-dependent hydrolase